PRRAGSSSIGDRLLPHLKSDVARILAHAHRNPDTVIREMLQLIDERIPFDREMLVCIDKRWYDRLAGQIYTSGAGRNGDLSFSPDGSEMPVCNDKRRIHNRCAGDACVVSGALQSGGGCSTV